MQKWVCVIVSFNWIFMMKELQLEVSQYYEWNVFWGKGVLKCKVIGDVTESATWGRTNYSN